MSTSSSRSCFENPVDYLPSKPLQEFAKGWVIYERQHPSGNLYFVVSGRVMVATRTVGGRQTIVRIVPCGRLFGESALGGEKESPEQAVTLEIVTLMAWSTAEIEQQIECEPNLGIALARYVTDRSIELAGRIESLAFYHTPERVGIALLQLAGSLGQAMPDGMIRVPLLTHQTIASFVGTTREIVTLHMNRLRRLRMIKYSRRHFDLNVPAMEESLRSRGVTIPVMGRESERVLHAQGAYATMERCPKPGPPGQGRPGAVTDL